MISIEHTQNRAEKTRDAQTALATSPGWVWNKHTVVQWNTDITMLQQLNSAEIAARTQWRNAAELWQVSIDRIQFITRQFVSIGRVQFQENPVKAALIDRLHTDGESRADIQEQGEAARDAWTAVDAAWEITEEMSLGAFGSLLSGALATKQTHGGKETALHIAELTLNFKAQEVDKLNLAWYAEATRRFGKDTLAGALIRRTVPTTTRPDKPVGQAVISHLMAAAGGGIHFDCAAPHATKFTYLHQPPGAPAFFVVLADSPEKSLTLHNQPAGLHKFKAIGRNSRGEGAESAVAEITLSAEQVA